VTPWVWFLIAGLAAAAGTGLLAADRGQQNAHQWERRRWAALRGWRFVSADPVLTERWGHGVIAGTGLARNLVTGSLFTPLGRRLVQIFDHEQDGQICHVVVAVQRRVCDPELVVELWLPPPPEDHGLIALGRAGDRFVVTSDPDQARALVSAEFVFAVDTLGRDVPLAWLEQDWVLTVAPYAVTPARLERLLRALDEIADLLDIAQAEGMDGADEIADLAELSSWGTNELSSRK
jgi:hypothetical protein